MLHMKKDIFKQKILWAIWNQSKKSKRKLYEACLIALWYCGYFFDIKHDNEGIFKEKPLESTGNQSI